MQKAFSTALINIASLGEVDKLNDRLGNQDIYHDGLILYLQAGEVVRLERNASIEINIFVEEQG